MPTPLVHETRFPKAASLVPVDVTDEGEIPTPCQPDFIVCAAFTAWVYADGCSCGDINVRPNGLASTLIGSKTAADFTVVGMTGD
jgi:hypothetical protein